MKIVVRDSDKLIASVYANLILGDTALLMEVIINAHKRATFIHYAGSDPVISGDTVAFSAIQIDEDAGCQEHSAEITLVAETVAEIEVFNEGLLKFSHQEKDQFVCHFVNRNTITTTPLVSWKSE